MHKSIYFYLLSVLIGILPLTARAESKKIDLPLKNLNTFVNKQVRDNYPYSGLAHFYNGVSAFVVSTETAKRVDSDQITLKENQWLAIVGHYKVLIFQNPGLSLTFNDDKIKWSLTGQSGDIDKVIVQAQLLSKSDLGSLPPVFENLKFSYLWEPFRVLCLGIESLFSWLNSIHYFGWGVSIVLLSLLFKIFILPANILLVRAQRKISYIQARLAPELTRIKANYSGEEAHNKFMAAHRHQGVTPFYTLKPLLLTLLPVPFLIAIFNVLGEMDQIAGHSLLWINNLAHPDAIFSIGFHIPFLGSTLNLLPILMTLLTIFAARLHQNKIVTTQELDKQKLNLYLMAFGFFVLFYPFPAAMVLYWTLANIWQLIQQRFVRI